MTITCISALAIPGGTGGPGENILRLVRGEVMGINKIFWLILAIGLISISILSSCSREKTDLSTIAPSQNEEATPATAPTETSISDYNLIVDGLVEHPLTLSYESILQYPAVTKNLLLTCPGVFETQNEWTGVLLSTILDQAGTKPEAAKIKFFSSGDYSSELTIEEARKNGTFLAYNVDGHVMTQSDGYPLRLVVEEKIGADWVKFLTHIEVYKKISPIAKTNTYMPFGANQVRNGFQESVKIVFPNNLDKQGF
jgi:DMSO/TMAO reductase YedYZ molybdopterin-dependent catalytic subunit